MARRTSLLLITATLSLAIAGAAAETVSGSAPGAAILVDDAGRPLWLETEDEDDNGTYSSVTVETSVSANAAAGYQPLAPPVPLYNSAPTYAPNSTLIRLFNEAAELEAANSSSVNTSSVTTSAINGVSYFYTFYRADLGYFNYKDWTYSPGELDRVRKVWLCHGNPESWAAPRVIGVTWFENYDTTRFKRCWFAAKDWNTGGLSIQTLSDPNRWAVMSMPKQSDGRYPVIFQNAGPWLRSCMEAERGQGTRGCPVVIGNYGESNSPAGINPQRHICRYVTRRKGSIKWWAFGWTDAKMMPDGSIRHNYCVGLRLGANLMPAFPEQRHVNFQLMVFRSQDLNRKVQPAAMPCGDGCRATINWPISAGYWPGMFDYDMTEGVYSLALDVASCCAMCQQTYGCTGYMYYGRNYNWCWLKTTTCFEQNRIGNVCFNPPPADQKQCLQGANHAGFNAIIPVQYRAGFYTGQKCWASLWKDRHDLANCPTDLVVYAETIAACCEACQAYNRITPNPNHQCKAWTHYKIERQCYIRKGACNFWGGVPNRSTVSALMTDTNQNLLGLY